MLLVQSTTAIAGMSADIIQIRDYQKVKPLTDPRTIEQQAAQFASELRDEILYESSMGHVAPPDDSA